MANIPTIPGSARVPDQQIGTKVDVQPRLQALGQLRKTVGQAAGALDEGLSAVADYEQRKRRAEEAAFFNQTSVTLMKVTSDARHNLKKQPDQDIVPNWTATSTATKQTIQDDPGFAKMSPDAQRELKRHLDSWQGNSTAEFQVNADKLASQRRNATAVAAKNAFLKTGDPAMRTNAVAALTAAKNAGDMTKQQFDFEVAGMDEQLEKNQILNGIDNNPYATLKKINAGGYKNVSETDLNALKNQAERQTNYVQRQTGDGLIDAFGTSGVPVDDTTLRDKVKAGTLTGEFVKNYHAMVAREDFHKAQDNQALLLTRLRDMDLSDSDNPEKDIRAVTDEAARLPPQLQKEIHTLADTRLKAAKRGQEQTLHADQLDAMRQAHEDSLGRIPISPHTDTEPARRAESVEEIEAMDDDKFHAEFGKDADRDEVVSTAKNFVKAENLRYAKAQKAYVEWSKTKKGSEASPQDAADERERLGFGRYTTTDDVIASYKAGKVDRATAKEILQRQFGAP